MVLFPDPDSARQAPAVTIAGDAISRTDLFGLRAQIDF